MGAYTGQALANSLASRLRDPAFQSIGYTRAMLIDILNRCQNSINARFGLVFNTLSFNSADRALYSFLHNPVFTRVIRPVEVSESDASAGGLPRRVLTEVPWNHLVHEHPQWMRLHGQPEVWARIGRDMIAVVPISPFVTKLAVKVITTASTPLVDNTNTSNYIPDEYVPMLLDLSEACMLFRGREFDNLQSVMARISATLGVEDYWRLKKSRSNPTHE